MKKILSILLIVVVTFSAIIITVNSDNDMHVIAIGQLIAHPALDLAREGFISGLAAEGFVEGQNVRFIKFDAYGDHLALTARALETVAQNPDLIFALATPTAQVFTRLTNMVPIVITGVNDPVEVGLVQSIDRPGTNVTGTSDWTPSGEANVGDYYQLGRTSAAMAAQILRGEGHPHEMPIQFFEGVGRPPIHQPPEITVLLNGTPIPFEVSPIIRNNRTLAPFRAIFEALGFDIEWYNATRTAIGMRYYLRIDLPIDSEFALVNGVPAHLDAPAMLHNERTMVPLRFIAEATGASVDWDGDTQTVMITTN